MGIAFNRSHLQDFLTFYFEYWPTIEKAQLKKLHTGEEGYEDESLSDAFKEN